MNGFDLLFPAPARLLVVLALAATMLLTIGLGRIVTGSNRPSVALFAGWGAAVFVFDLAGTLLAPSFRLVAGLLLIPAMAGLALLARERLGDRPAWSRAGRILLLAAPLIVIVAGMRASQWDELTHWLPNGHFLALHDRFPSAALPNPVSSWPAYPYALPLISYLSGLLLGGFSDVAGMLFNLALLIASAWMIGDVIADHRAASASQPETSRLALWGSAAFALLVAIPLNPSFVTKLSFTNYSDSATSCALAIAAVVALRWLDAAFAQRRERYGLAVALGCVLTVLVGLRQANLSLFGLVIAGFAFALLLEGKLFDRRSSTGLLALPMPVLAAWLWQRYTAAEMPSGAFQFLPWTEWHFDQIGQIAGSIWHVMLSKGGHFGLMAALAALGVATVARPALLDLRARVLCRTMLVLFLGYTGFLFVAYVSLFQGSEVASAASFWRYSTQLGMIGIVTAVHVVLCYWRLRPSLGTRLGAAAIALVVLAPLAGVKFIRFDVEHPHDGFLLAVSRDLAAALPAGARLDLLDPHGSFSDMQLIRYHLLLDGGRDPAAAASVHVTIDVDAVTRAAPRSGAGDYVWLADGGPDMRQVFGQDLPEGAGYLLERQTDGYRLIRVWPDTRETEIFHAADFN
jgi:hypothetical protein